MRRTVGPVALAQMLLDPLLGVALVRRAGQSELVAGGAQAREEDRRGLRSSGAVGQAA